jgi:hypothetical protein
VPFLTFAKGPRQEVISLTTTGMMQCHVAMAVGQKGTVSGVFGPFWPDFLPGR